MEVVAKVSLSWSLLDSPLSRAKAQRQLPRLKNQARMHLVIEQDIVVEVVAAG